MTAAVYRRRACHTTHDRPCLSSLGIRLPSIYTSRCNLHRSISGRRYRIRLSVFWKHCKIELNHAQCRVRFICQVVNGNLSRQILSNLCSLTAMSLRTTSKREPCTSPARGKGDLERNLTKSSSAHTRHRTHLLSPEHKTSAQESDSRWRVSTDTPTLTPY
jgi:hypothetical protein